MFFAFDQNNSGGSFDGDYYVIIIEADTAEEANNRATTETDIYFDGVYNGYDCSCCGDRWNEAWQEDGDEVPSLYGRPIEEYVKDNPHGMWGLSALVLYKDGRKEVHKDANS